MIRIAVDDGHGMETPGKRTPVMPNGYVMRENEFNSAVAKKLVKKLKACGFAVVEVAAGDTDVSLADRVNFANRNHADFYISIHANASGDGVSFNSAEGIETFVYSLADAETYNIAKEIHKCLIEETGRRDRGVKANPGLYVLNSTNMPAALVECGFMTNLNEANLLLSEDYREDCARAICKGLCKAYEVDYKGGDDVKVERIQMFINGKKVEVERVLVNNTNYVKIRDVATALDMEVSSVGSIPVLNEK